MHCESICIFEAKMTTKMPYKILCVCLGNICRSPTAEVVMKHFADLEKLNIQVDSAGTSNYHPNKAPDHRSQKHALKRGYDLSSLRARQIRIEDFKEFDLILAMDHENLVNIQKLQVEAAQIFQNHELRAKIELMSAKDPSYLNQPVPDPYYGGDDGFELVLDQCESNSKAWISYLKPMLQQSNVE